MSHKNEINALKVNLTLDWISINYFNLLVNTHKLFVCTLDVGNNDVKYWQSDYIYLELYCYNTQLNGMYAGPYAYVTILNFVLHVCKKDEVKPLILLQYKVYIRI